MDNKTEDDLLHLKVRVLDANDRFSGAVRAVATKEGIPVAALRK